MRSTRYGLIDFSVRRSTVIPSSSEISRSILTNSRRLFLSLNSTRMSISLSGLASPRAYEPKIAMRFAPSLRRYALILLCMSFLVIPCNSIYACMMCQPATTIGRQREDGQRTRRWEDHGVLLDAGSCAAFARRVRSLG